MWVPPSQTANLNLLLSLQKPQLELRVGQIIQAKVIEGSPEGEGGGKVLLSINKENIAARTQVPLRQGQLVKAEVTSTQGEIILKLQHQQNTPAQTHIQARQKLRQIIAQPAELRPLLTELKQINQHINQLPIELQTSIKKLLQQIPQWNQLSKPGALKEIINNSGIFYENAVANGKAPQTDLKSLLLAVSQKLRALNNSYSQNNTQQPPSSAPENSRPNSSTQTLHNRPTENKPAPDVYQAAKQPNNDTGLKPAALTSQQTIKPDQAQKPLVENTPTSHPDAKQTKPASEATQSTQSATAEKPLSTEKGSTESQPYQKTQDLLKQQSKLEPLPFRENGFKAMGRIQTEAKPTPVRLEQWLSDFKSQVDSAINRISIQQLSRSDVAHAPPVNTEIPILAPDGSYDIIRMRWKEPEQEQKQSGSLNKNDWIVEVSFDLPALGPLYARVALNEALEINLRIWIERDSAEIKLQKALPGLHQRLKDKGLAIATMECLRGNPPDSLTNSTSEGSDTPLLDTRA
ncbi:MAG: flagellar hook-length control protein FliK [bacterium]